MIKLDKVSFKIENYFNADMFRPIFKLFFQNKNHVMKINST